jgi:hypothetical protein
VLKQQKKSPNDVAHTWAIYFKNSVKCGIHQGRKMEAKNILTKFRRRLIEKECKLYKRHNIQTSNVE